MCPACLTTVALTVVGATSTGGLVAFLARRLPGKKRPKQSPRPGDERARDDPRVETAKGD
jgi:hypothetical protein